MSTFEALLQLQEHDTGIDQLRHRLANLPERAAVVSATADAEQLERDAAPVQERHDAVAREQKRLEDEVASVEAKAAEVHHRLYESGVTSPKEAQALQADLDSLQRRQSQIEDQVLERMEELEPIDGELDELDRRRRELEAARSTAQAALSEAASVLDEEIRRAEHDRSALAELVDAGLVTTYEQLRSQLGGVAVARLVGTQCGGCHLALSAVALEAVRRMPVDAVAHCEECGRILVR